ncbi:MAG: tetratricopeptide repeat protein [Armatimonadetes bacterium]|nr:tetratricopeptide repeat protein [Armatimonadota bacterium]
MIQGDDAREHGDTQKATDRYNQVLQGFPDFAPAQKGLALLVVEDPANSAKAFDLATKARKVLPDDSDLAKVLATVSFQRKDFSRAIQLFQESGRKKPLDATSLFYLGMSQSQAGQKSAARESLNKALAAGLREPNAAEAKKALAEPNR